MEPLYKDSSTLRRMREGPLGAYIDTFFQQMVEQGYARFSIRYALQLFADLGRWMRRNKITVRQLSAEQLACYLRDRIQCHHFRTGDASILRRLLNLLIGQGIVAQAPPIEPTPAERLEAEFRRYLEQERRLSPSTVLLYMEFGHRFLAQITQDGEVHFDHLRAAGVVSFVQREAARLHHAKRAKLMTSALRSFLQYARYRGLIAADLRDSVPTVANWSMASLPKALSADEVQRLLSGCERKKTAVSRRNGAILLLLARLGLRAGEVVGLTLDDIDWAAGTLGIHGAGTPEDRLPIPQDVGAALADYLCHVRPVCASRRVFVRMRAPYRGFASSAAISSLVRRALDRAGLDPAHKGAHLLRHTVATQMLRQGASLAEIGELLRHRSQQTTMIYAKVDLDLLRPLALPWPGGAS